MKAIALSQAEGRRSNKTVGGRAGYRGQEGDGS